jgi:hypothetical protein
MSTVTQESSDLEAAVAREDGESSDRELVGRLVGQARAEGWSWSVRTGCWAG